MTEKIKMEYFDIDDIKPYDNNPRVNEDAVDSVAESIKNYGFKVPIVLDKDNVIVTGHTRRLAALKLGMKKVPCIVAEDLTPEQVNAFRLDDNKTAEFAMWDFSKLADELQGLQDSGYDMETLAFDMDEIDRILSDGNDDDAVAETGETDADEVPDCDAFEDDEKSEIGKTYQLGSHRLRCGFPENRNDVNVLFAGDGETPAELLLMSFCGGTGTIELDTFRDDEEHADIMDIMCHSADRMNAGASYYILHDERLDLYSAVLGAGMTCDRQLVWNMVESQSESETYRKQHYPVMFGFKQGSPFRWYGSKNEPSIITVKANSKNGSSGVPVDLYKKFISNSTMKNDMVYVPFAHVGDELMACEQTGRKCRAMEHSPISCDVIRRRWAEYKYGEGCDWESLTPESTGVEE